VLEGTVTFTSKATGDAVTVEAGLGSTATDAGVSAPVPFDVGAVTADWAALEAGMAADGPPPSAEPTQETTVSPAPGVTTPPESTLLEVSDRAGKLKGGASEPTFTIDAPYLVTIIETFHWNGGRGATPGTIRLLTEGGDVMGPWQATGRPGPGDVADAYWVVEPGVVLPAGTYRIVDSEPATWTHSSWTKGLGYAEVRGRPSS
jgi:hypothetical protein